MTAGARASRTRDQGWSSSRSSTRTRARSGSSTMSTPRLHAAARPTFAGWLAEQQDRTDRIGDLARDFAADVDGGCMPLGIRSVDGLRRHLRAMHATAPARELSETVDRAAAEWSSATDAAA